MQPSRGTTLNKLSQPVVVEQVEAFMQRNLQRPLSRADLAKVAHLSATHLARIFHQATGHTLTERLIELRMTSAKQLLLESTLPVSEISFQVGYSSFSHFARLFRQKVGVSPTDYRRSQGMVWRKMDI
jgi:two-component system response regulator YesN